MKNMKRSQSGFVSIIVALVVMILVSLIALGFAFLVRHNQIQNANRALSTQAFYAAESGVNDARQYIKSQVAGGNIPADITNCSALSKMPGNSAQIDPNNTEVRYTCVLLDAAPTTLEGQLDGSNSQILRVQSKSGSPLKSITISWQDSNGSTAFANNPQHGLPQTSYTPNNGNNLYTSTGIVRATLIPVSYPLTRAALQNNPLTLFLYPNRSQFPNNPGSITINGPTGSQGAFVDGGCNASAADRKPLDCSVVINNIDTLASTDTFYVRLKGLYRSSRFVVSATDANGTARLINGQAVVDATGKDQDVVRRIQVRLPLQVTSQQPEFAVESGNSICKRYSVWGGGDPGILVESPSPTPSGFDGASFNAACHFPDAANPN